MAGKRNGEQMTLTRTGEAKGASFYIGDDGEKYFLRQVDREYSGRPKPPKFYLETVRAGKPHYLSGLFPTEKAGVFSLDLKDTETGLRVMYMAMFEQEGETVKLQPKIRP
jgi:hypothetical protein